MNYIDIAIYVVALAFGIGFLPGIWYLFGKELPRGFRGVIARITWTIASLIHGPYAAYWRDNGRVEIVEADPEKDRIRVDGEWRDVDPDGNWSRLGKQPFFVTYEKSPQAFDGTLVEGEESGDGGLYLGRRGGQHIGTRFRNTAEQFVVDLGRVTARWRGAAGGVLADAAKKDALIQYGGSVDISTRWLVMGIVASLALGTVSGWIMFA